MKEHCTTPRNGSKYLQVAVLDEKGKVVSNSRVDNNMIKVNEFFDTLHPGNNTKVVMESSGMWYNIHESLRKKNLDVRLSNPAKTRDITSVVASSIIRNGSNIAIVSIMTRRSTPTRVVLPLTLVVLH